jgi:hypothetical protein
MRSARSNGRLTTQLYNEIYECTKSTDLVHTGDPVDGEYGGKRGGRRHPLAGTVPHREQCGTVPGGCRRHDAVWTPAMSEMRLAWEVAVGCTMILIVLGCCGFAANLVL